MYLIPLDMMPKEAVELPPHFQFRPYNEILNDCYRYLGRIYSDKIPLVSKPNGLTMNSFHVNGKRSLDKKKYLQLNKKCKYYFFLKTVFELIWFLYIPYRVAWCIHGTTLAPRICYNFILFIFYHSVPDAYYYILVMTTRS